MNYTITLHKNKIRTREIQDKSIGHLNFSRKGKLMNNKLKVNLIRQPFYASNNPAKDSVISPISRSITSYWCSK